MDTKILPKLRVVDISGDNLKPGTSRWISVRNDIVQALEQHGCFVAVYDKVSTEISNSIFGASQDLFNLPLETKLQNTSPKPLHGYGGQYKTLPLYEGLSIDDATNLEQVQSFTNLMWPAGNEAFCETAHLFAKLVADLNEMMLRMVFESYGVEKYYDNHNALINYLLRFIEYRVPKMNETDLGLHSHTDKTFTTIVHQNEINGLEIQTKDGEWMLYESSPSSFLVYAGDLFMAWSNGRIHSPTHRVMMRGQKVRRTLVQFTFMNGVMEIPKELVDDKHPLMFKPIDHIGAIHFLETEQGKKADRESKVLQVYCGV